MFARITLVSLLLVGTAVADTKPAPKRADARIEVRVTAKGFEPEPIHVPAKTPITLVFTRQTERTCTKKIVLNVDGKTIEKELPLDKPVEIAATFPKAGTLGYTCSMKMNKGTIVVQ